MPIAGHRPAGTGIWIIKHDLQRVRTMFMPTDKGMFTSVTTMATGKTGITTAQGINKGGTKTETDRIRARSQEKVTNRITTSSKTGKTHRALQTINRITTHSLKTVRVALGAIHKAKVQATQACHLHKNKVWTIHTRTEAGVHRITTDPVRITEAVVLPGVVVHVVAGEEGDGREKPYLHRLFLFSLKTMQKRVYYTQCIANSTISLAFLFRDCSWTPFSISLRW